MRKLKHIGTIAAIGLVVSLGGLATPATAALDSGGFSVKAQNADGQVGIRGTQSTTPTPGEGNEEPPAPWSPMSRIDMSCQAASTWAGGTDRVYWSLATIPGGDPERYRALITVNGETETRELGKEATSVELDSYSIFSEKHVQVEWFSKSQKRWSDSYTVFFPEKQPDELNSSCWQIVSEG